MTTVKVSRLAMIVASAGVIFVSTLTGCVTRERTERVVPYPVEVGRYPQRPRYDVGERRERHPPYYEADRNGRARARDHDRDHDRDHNNRDHDRDWGRGRPHYWDRDEG